MRVVEVVVTGPRDVMPDLVNALVRDRLIAGAHLMPIESTYWWEGIVRDAPETRVAMHTTDALVDALKERVREQHPYQVACIVVAPFSDGNPDYLAWVEAETQS